MAPPQWAFQLENFEPAPHDELICSICRCVFCDPVECSCRHVFCKACIGKWHELHNTCPICRKYITQLSVRPVNLIIQNLILGLTLRCKNSTSGCDIIIRLEQCESHLKECQYELEECTNSCGKTFLRKDRTKHKQQECPFRKVECNLCGLNLDGPAVSHNCIEALKRCVDDTKAAKAQVENRLQQVETELQGLKRQMNQRSRIPDIDLDLWSSCFEYSDDDYESSVNTISSSSSSSTSLSFSSPSSPSSDDEVSLDVMIMPRAAPINESSPAVDISWNSGEFHSIRNSDNDIDFDVENDLSVGNDHLAAGVGDPSVAFNCTISLDDSPQLPGSHNVIIESDSGESDSPVTPPSTYFLSKKRCITSDLSDDSNYEQRVGARKTQRAASNDDSAVSASGSNQSRGRKGLPKSKKSRLKSHRTQSAGNFSQPSTSRPVESSGTNSKREKQPDKKKSLFKTTIDLMAQHAVESDPDWMPDLWLNLKSESEESLPDILTDSDSSYEVQIPTPTLELLQRYSKSDSEDPEWLP